MDGIVYRWRESHGHHDFELRVEHFAQPGQLLLVHFAYLALDPAQPQHVYRPIMTHRVLAAAIALGLSRGWTPQLAKPLLALDPHAGATLVSAYDYRYSKWTVKTATRYL